MAVLFWFMVKCDLSSVLYKHILDKSLFTMYFPHFLKKRFFYGTPFISGGVRNIKVAKKHKTLFCPRFKVWTIDHKLILSGGGGGGLYCLSCIYYLIVFLSLISMYTIWTLRNFPNSQQGSKKLTTNVSFQPLHIGSCMLYISIMQVFLAK